MRLDGVCWDFLERSDIEGEDEQEEVLEEDELEDEDDDEDDDEEDVQEWLDEDRERDTTVSGTCVELVGSGGTTLTTACSVIDPVGVAWVTWVPVSIATGVANSVFAPESELACTLTVFLLLLGDNRAMVFALLEPLVLWFVWEVTVVSLQHSTRLLLHSLPFTWMRLSSWFSTFRFLFGAVRPLISAFGVTLLAVDSSFVVSTIGKVSVSIPSIFKSIKDINIDEKLAHS